MRAPGGRAAAAAIRATAGRRRAAAAAARASTASRHPTARRSWTSSRRSPGPAAATRPWLRRSGAFRRLSGAARLVGNWCCRYALARMQHTNRCRSLRSGLQLLGGVPEDPHRYANTVKPPQRGRCYKKSSLPLKEPNGHSTRRAKNYVSNLHEKPHSARHGCLSARRLPCRLLAAQPDNTHPDGTRTRRAVTPAPLPTPEGKSRPRAA